MVIWVISSTAAYIGLYMQMIPITRYDSKTFFFIFVFYSHYTLNSQQLHSTLRLDIYQCSVDRSIQFKTWSFVPKLTLIIKKSKKNSVKLGLLGNTEIGAVQPLLEKKWITMSSWEALLMKVCLNLLAQTTLSTAWDSLENGKTQVTNQHSDHSCFKNRHSFCLKL